MVSDFSNQTPVARETNDANAIQTVSLFTGTFPRLARGENNNQSNNSTVVMYRWLWQHAAGGYDARFAENVKRAQCTQSEIKFVVKNPKMLIFLLLLLFIYLFILANEISILKA